MKKPKLTYTTNKMEELWDHIRERAREKERERGRKNTGKHASIPAPKFSNSPLPEL